MFIFRKTKKVEKTPINSKFHLSDFVDFWHRDDLYFGTISNIYLDKENQVIYDIDIAGQCPTTYQGVPESKIVRIHKEK